MANSPSPEGRKGMFRATLAASLGALVIGGLGLMTVTASNASAEEGEKKVTLCHATGSESNPFVEVTVSQNSVIQGGHGGHAGDIIPKFEGYDGKNLGMLDILGNGCMKSQPTETKTETATPSGSGSPTVTVTATATETATATAMSTQTATATVTAPAGGAAAESASATAAPGEAGQSPSATAGGTTVSGGEAATSPTSANAGGGAGENGGVPTWALGLLGAGVLGTALSSIGLARNR